jgi:Family of unknown function (DUF6152)
MKAKLAVLSAVVAALFMVSVPLLAHHGRGGYDNQKLLSLKAVITKFDWINPHVTVYFDATDEKGVLQHWSCEGENPYTATRQGWTKNEFKPGDQVTINFHPAKNGNGVGFFVSAILPDGRMAYYGLPPAADAK